MYYIQANDDVYWVASRFVIVEDYDVRYSFAGVIEGQVTSIGANACSSIVEGGSDTVYGDPAPLRPVVILPSDIPYDDVVIGNYVTYD